MAQDLNEIRERLHYCETEANTLERAKAAYLKRNIEVRRQNHPDHFAIQLRIGKDVPIQIRSRLGTTIHEIRSCLDALACTLAERNSKDSKGVYFPISKTKGVFDTDGMQKIKKLSDADQAAIIGLTPYGGGDDLLFGMHEFDRTRKHQRLGVSYPGFAGLAITQMESMHLIEMGPVPRLTNEWQTAATFAPHSVFEARLMAEVSFETPPQLRGDAIDKGLRQFLQKAREIVGLFD